MLNVVKEQISSITKTNSPLPPCMNERTGQAVSGLLGLLLPSFGSKLLPCIYCRPHRSWLQQPALAPAAVRSSPELPGSRLTAHVVPSDRNLCWYHQRLHVLQVLVTEMIFGHKNLSFDTNMHSGALEKSCSVLTRCRRSSAGCYKLPIRINILGLYSSELTTNVRTDMTLHSQSWCSWLPGLNVKPFCFQVEGYTLGLVRISDCFTKYSQKQRAMQKNTFIQ